MPKGNNSYRSSRKGRKYADAERIVQDCSQSRTRRRKERIALHSEFAMSIATYRGVKYDTETHQSDFKAWWNRIHCDATRWLTYRGKKYRTFGECKL